MKLTTNFAIQLAALAVGIVTQVTPLLPVKAQGYTVGAAGLVTVGAQIIQGITSIMAHHSDTQGNALPPAPKG
jgi:hypothetical protein